MRAPSTAIVLLAAAAGAGGCLFGGGGRQRPAGADAGRWLRARSDEPAAAAGSEAQGLQPLRSIPLGPPRGEEPKAPEEIAAALGDARAGRRLLGLVAAARTRPPEVLPALTRLARRDPVFGEPAAEVIAAYPDPAGRQALLETLRRGVPEARAVAVLGLGRRGFRPDNQVERALAVALEREPDWRVRAAAARAVKLSVLGVGSSAWNPGAIIRPALAARLRDPEEMSFARLECAGTLAWLGDEAGWEQLAEAAAAPDRAEAEMALLLAAEAGGRRGAEILGAALASDRPERWTAAARLFERVGRGAALEALAGRLREGGEIGRRAAVALAPLEGPRLAGELALAMEQGSQVLRAEACRALARAAGADAAPALERKLADAGEVARVRAAAAAALALAAGPASRRALAAAAEDGSDAVVRAAARDALALLDARLAQPERGQGPPGEAELERRALARWRLVAPAPNGCRLRDAGGREREFRIGEEVALGYRLSAVLVAGEEPSGPEALLAGPGVADARSLRAVLVKGARAAVLAAPAVREF